MWEIAKQFDFCYGHRVWSQNLNPEFSLDSCLKCRHLHGHQGTINIFLSAGKLTDGMVTDFKHLNWFKKWLDDTLDHKFIMDQKDPALFTLFPRLDYDQHGCDFTDAFSEMHFENQTFDVVNPLAYAMLPAYEKEILEGLVFVPFVPTSENISKWIFDIISYKMQALCIVSKVQFFETPKSQSNYTNNL